MPLLRGLCGLKAVDVVVWLQFLGKSSAKVKFTPRKPKDNMDAKLNPFPFRKLERSAFTKMGNRGFGLPGFLREEEI